MGDRLASAHGQLKEAGLDREETILDLFNSSHRMIVDIATIANTSERIAMPTCTQFFAMYVVLRQKGESPDRARRGIVAIFKGLSNIGK